MGASGGGRKCVRSLGHLQNGPAEAITQQAASSTLSHPHSQGQQEMRWADAAGFKVSALKEWLIS